MRPKWSLYCHVPIISLQFTSITIQRLRAPEAAASKEGSVDLSLPQYMIPGPPLPEPGFFHRICSCFQLSEASICLTNPRFEINDLKSMIWNPHLLMITNASNPALKSGITDDL